MNRDANITQGDNVVIQPDILRSPSYSDSFVSCLLDSIAGNSSKWDFIQIDYIISTVEKRGLNLNMA